METPSDVVHFSTDALPERDRMAIWREVFGRHLLKLEFEPIPDERFYVTSTLRSLSGLSLATGTRAGFSAARTRKLIADSDDLVLTINTEGTAYASQFGRETPIAPYEGVFLSAADLGKITYPTHARYIAVSLPRKTIAPLVNDLDTVLARRLPQGEAMRLLTTYATGLDGQNLTSPALRHAFATHLLDLITLTIGANSEAAEVARSRGLRAARLRAIKGDVQANMTDERLSVTDIASRQNVTARYVQLLFEADGGTFSEYLVEQRLARAYRMLTEAGYADRTIGAIAFDVGFSNLSYFNRTFRRRYGVTPSDVRESAGRNA
jgi:AraC-like DNA-binding protein